MESPRKQAIERSMKEQAEKKKKKERREFKPRGPEEKMIAMSRWVAFRRKDRKLIIKLFRYTLDDYLKRSKKSHWIKLECLWTNLGCKTTYDKKKDDIYPKK